MYSSEYPNFNLIPQKWQSLIKSLYNIYLYAIIEKRKDSRRNKKMKTEKIATNRVKFTFTVTPEEFEHGLGHAFEHKKGEVEIKGFRKGHVPRNVYESKFGIESLYPDALEHVVHHKYHDAQNHPDFELVGQPSVDYDAEKISTTESFDVIIESDVKPEVKLGDYKGIEVKVEAAEVTDEEVNQAVNELLSKNAELEVKEGPIAAMDTAIFDFEGFVNEVAFEGGKAENYQLQIGSGQFIPGFEDQMIGMKAGDSKDVNVTFPEQYQSADLAGKDAVFKVTVHEVKVAKKAELNDEWVKGLNREGVETVDALKESIKNETLTQKEQKADQAFTDQLFSKVVDNASFEVPESMIKEEFNQQVEHFKRQAQQYNMDYEMMLQMYGFTQEIFETQAKIESEKRVKLTLVLEAVAKAEDLKATPEELNNKIDEFAKQYNLKPEQVTQYLPAFLIEKDIVVDKAYTLVKDAAKRV